MLGTILAVLLLAVIAVCVFIRVQSRKKRDAKRWPLIVIAVAALIFLIVPFSIHTIQPGQVGVVKVWGEAKNVRTPGTYFDFWISNQYQMYDTTVQQEEIKTACYSSDAQTMDIDMVVQYQIRSADAIKIANNYGALPNLAQRISAISMDKAKTVLSEKSAMVIIETRSSISPAIEQSIKEAVSEGYCVDIIAVVITNIDFSDAFEETVEDKMIAEQEQLKAEYEKQKAIIEAEKELEVAKLQAEANIAKAQGEAEATKVRAQAEANALKAKSIEVARMLGFNILESTQDDGKGGVVTVYDIDFAGKSDEEITLISEYLKYIEYLEKWDGDLPLVTDGSATIYLPAGTGSSGGTSTNP